MSKLSTVCSMVAVAVVLSVSATWGEETKAAPAKKKSPFSAAYEKWKAEKAGKVVKEDPASEVKAATEATEKGVVAGSLKVNATVEDAAEAAGEKAEAVTEAAEEVTSSAEETGEALTEKATEHTGSDDKGSGSKVETAE